MLLRIAWPEGAEGRLHGGPVMLTVRGNRVLYRRQPASGPHWTRAVLTGPNMEAFFAALRGLPRVPSGGYPCEVWIGEEQTESFQVAEAELLMQLQQLPGISSYRCSGHVDKTDFEATFPFVPGTEVTVTFEAPGWRKTERILIPEDAPTATFTLDAGDVPRVRIPVSANATLRTLHLGMPGYLSGNGRGLARLWTAGQECEGRRRLRFSKGSIGPSRSRFHSFRGTHSQNSPAFAAGAEHGPSTQLEFRHGSSTAPGLGSRPGALLPSTARSESIIRAPSHDTVAKQETVKTSA